MKKVWLALSLSFMLVLTACGSSGEKNVKTDSSEQASVSESKVSLTDNVADLDSENLKAFESNAQLSDDVYLQCSKHFVNEIAKQLNELKVVDDAIKIEASKTVYNKTFQNGVQIICITLREDGHNCGSTSVYIPQEHGSEYGDKAFETIAHVYGYSADMKPIFENIEKHAKNGAIVNDDEVEGGYYYTYAFPSDKSPRLDVSFGREY